MVRYQNTSMVTKEFYGISFGPGKEENVPGYINDPSMVRVPIKPNSPKRLSGSSRLQNEEAKDKKITKAQEVQQIKEDK